MEKHTLERDQLKDAICLNTQYLPLHQFTAQDLHNTIKLLLSRRALSFRFEIMVYILLCFFYSGSSASLWPQGDPIYQSATSLCHSGDLNVIFVFF
eukprot:147872_1